MLPKCSSVRGEVKKSRGVRMYAVVLGARCLLQVCLVLTLPCEEGA